MRWRLTLQLGQASILLSEMAAQAFTPSSRSSSTSSRGHTPAGLKPRRCRARPAAPQQMKLDGDAWWDGEVDPWTEAESRALLQQFKDSVLDEDGLSVRAMSDEDARRLADKAADGLLELAERELRSKAPPSTPLSRGRLFDPSSPSDPAAAAAAAAATFDEHGTAWRESEKRGRGGINGHFRGDGSELEYDGGVFDWGDGVDREGGTGLVGAATEGFPHAPMLLESVGDRAEYESTLAALKAYHRQHGNLLLTQKYLMPCEDEDGQGGVREHQGWRLGHKAYNMKFWKRHVRDRPSRREELAALGFVWGRLQDEYNLFVEALLAYRDIEGSLLVPHSFVVPEAAPWPLCCQGMRLGAKVSGVRNQSLYVRSDVARWYQLDAMGFVWDLSDAPFRQVYEALLTYKSQHGNLHVPVAFCVPSTPPWPQDLWGLALGQRVLDIRARHRYIRNDPERIRLLNEVGFRWTDAAKASYGNVVRALKAYRKIKGRDLSVPSSFVVPSFLPWPQSCWGLRLGTALVDIRSKGRYLKGEEKEQRRRELERLGVFAQSREAILAKVVKGFRSYLDIVGDAKVPQGFVVPDGEAWPQECRGQKLGWMLYGLRRRPERLDRHPEVRAELTALGFSWEAPPRKGSRSRGRPGRRQGAKLAPAPAPAPVADAADAPAAAASDSASTTSPSVAPMGSKSRGSRSGSGESGRALGVKLDDGVASPSTLDAPGKGLSAAASPPNGEAAAPPLQPAGVKVAEAVVGTNVGGDGGGGGGRVPSGARRNSGGTSGSGSSRGAQNRKIAGRRLAPASIGGG